jgi:hypothetical protein
VLFLSIELRTQGLLGLIDQLLDAGQRTWCHLSELPGQCKGFLQSRASRSERMHQAQGVPPLRGLLLAQPQASQGAAAAQEPCQMPTAATIRRQGHLAVGHHEAGALCRDDQVACQRQRHAATGCHALNGGQHGLGEAA